jgi:periplasmic protein TonB
MMTEMDETDLGLDAEPESASEAPEKAATAAAADPEMEDLLAAEKLSEAPPVEPPSPPPRAASGAVAAGETTDEAAPLPLPLPALKAVPAAVVATGLPQERAQPQPAASPQRTQPIPEDAPDEIELAAIGGSTRSDRSRSPMLAGNGQWDCPFPSEAARAGVDSAIVTLRVEVTADNQIESVIVLRDPGDGFGREARRCALSKRWQAGLDREGRAAHRTTVVSVHFQRKG